MSWLGPRTRLRLEIAYAGTGFSGWASQPGRRTVQSEIEYALAQILRAPAALTVAGRTDAGVHAVGQVAHVDVDPRSWDELAGSIVRRLAGLLPGDVRVRSVVPAADGFDARFSAIYRRYTYRIGDARWGVDPLRRHDTLATSRRLDDEAMQAAAQRLLGEHDFAAFCRRREGATTIRELQRLDVERDGDDDGDGDGDGDGDIVTVTARADAFCHSMVRSLVGALLAVGEGRKADVWPAGLLPCRGTSQRGRRSAGARTHAGRGRVSAGRRPGRARRADPPPPRRPKRLPLTRRLTRPRLTQRLTRPRLTRRPTWLLLVGLGGRGLRIVGGRIGGGGSSGGGGIGGRR